MKHLRKYHIPGKHESIQKVKLFIVAFVSVAWITLVVTGLVKNREERLYSQHRLESMEATHIHQMTGIPYHM